MTEHNAIEAIVAESYRTKIDAEDLRREVKALLNEAIKQRPEAKTILNQGYWHGMETAYSKVLKIVDEKEKGR